MTTTIPAAYLDYARALGYSGAAAESPHEEIMNNNVGCVGDCGVAYEPGQHYPGHDYRWFAGWGATYCVQSADEAWSDLADALEECGHHGMAVMARDRVGRRGS